MLKQENRDKANHSSDIYPGFLLLTLASGFWLLAVNTFISPTWAVCEALLLYSFQKHPVLTPLLPRMQVAGMQMWTNPNPAHKALAICAGIVRSQKLSLPVKNLGSTGSGFGPSDNKIYIIYLIFIYKYIYLYNIYINLPCLTFASCWQDIWADMNKYGEASTDQSAASA